MSNFLLTLKNLTTKKEDKFAVENENDENSIYYSFTINTLGLDEGDYIIELRQQDDGPVILRDLLRIGITPEYYEKYEKEDSDGYITYNKAK